MNAFFAISTAGHDAGKVYIIVGTKNDTVFLADGIKRTVGKPKMKNRKHIKLIDQKPDLKVMEYIRKGCGDEAIRQAIRHFNIDATK